MPGFTKGGTIQNTMRRKDKEITDEAVIREILEKSSFCRIALLDGDLPYIVPMNYGFSGGALFFHTARVGKKTALIQQNKRVCFEIEYAAEVIRHEQSCSWSTRYRSVIGYGTLEIITDAEEKKKGLDAIMAHYGKKDNNQYHDPYVARIFVLKLTIDQISGKQSGDW
jgi:nitroimidazol reductase NimA-like FMN-containing flavoprotein (pyridoxamine 5'-phosphate oxidase superfamily)